MNCGFFLMILDHFKQNGLPIYINPKFKSLIDTETLFG